MSLLHFTEDKRENLASGGASHSPSGAVRTRQRQIVGRIDQSEASVQGLVDRFTDMKVERVENILVALEIRNHKALWIYQNKRWVKQCDVPTEFPETDMCFCAVTGGIIALGGEMNYHHKSSLCYFYSLSKQRWQKLLDMRTPRAGASCAEIKNMVVMVVGGRGAKEKCSVACEILDIKRGQWFPATPLPERFSSTAQIRVVAGRPFIFEHGLLTQYDPKSDTFSEKATLSVNTDSIQLLAAVENKMYVIVIDYTCVFQYDSTTDQWTTINAPRMICLYCGGNTVIARGKNILLCVGEPRTKIEEFNTVTHQ